MSADGAIIRWEMPCNTINTSADLEKQIENVVIDSEVANKEEKVEEVNKEDGEEVNKEDGEQVNKEQESNGQEGGDEEKKATPTNTTGAFESE